MTIYFPSRDIFKVNLQKLPVVSSLRKNEEGIHYDTHQLRQERNICGPPMHGFAH